MTLQSYIFLLFLQSHEQTKSQVDIPLAFVISHQSPNNVTTSHNRPTNSNASMRNPRKPPIRANGRVKMFQSQTSKSSRTGPNILITTTTITIVSIMESIICPLILSGYPVIFSFSPPSISPPLPKCPAGSSVSGLPDGRLWSSNHRWAPLSRS